VRRRTWDEIVAGEALAPLEYPITQKTLALQVAGNRDFFPYHHNAPFTRALGIRDTFVNTTFYQGLFGRYATDWSGPDAMVRAQRLQMLDQLCPGDRATVKGAVSRTWTEGAEHLVEIAATVGHERGVTARCTTVLAVGASAGAAVAPRELPEPPAPQVREDAPEFARTDIGRALHRDGPYPVSEAQIMYWCEMVRDANPRYALDTAYPGGMIAPPQSLVMWGQPRATQMGLDPRHPDADLPDQDAWPVPAENFSFSFRAPDTTELIVQEVVCEFGTPLRPGDRVSVTYELTDCSPLKTTRLGPGYFVTGRETYRTGSGAIAGTCTMAMLQYGIRALV
jgi:acyl dehydratase